MFVLNNTIHSFKAYFFDRLKLTYAKEELEQLYALTFYYFKNWNKVELRMNEQSLLSESELLELNSIVKRLESSEPIQHIFSKSDFFDLVFFVDKNVLIPRQETEELVNLILENSKGNNKRLLDIGTGSGCIPISISVNNNNIKVSGIDICEEAIRVAKKNAIAYQVELKLYCEDILQVNDLNTIINSPVEIIVSNPPYITIKEKSLMHKNVLDFDPHLALFVDDDSPLVFYEKIAKLAYNKLENGGELYFEINEYFGEDTKELVEGFGFSSVTLIKDLNEKDRIVYAIK